MENLPMLNIRQELMMPDNDQWQHRFEIHSSTSNRVYTIAQNKKGKYWACSCPGWKRHRKCRHLESLGLPAKEKPYEVNIVKY